MDDVWISGRLAQAGVPRFVVPFDEDQFTRTPGFENVTTLDSAHISSGGGGGGRAAPGPTRQQSNEEALRYFQKDWDVAWSPPKYHVVPYKYKPTKRGRRPGGF